MGEQTIEEMLDELERVYAEARRVGDEFMHRREEIMKPVAAQLELLDAEIDAAWGKLSAQMAKIEKAVKRAVAARRRDAMSARLHAVYLGRHINEPSDENDVVIIPRYDDAPSNN